MHNNDYKKSLNDIPYLKDLGHSSSSIIDNLINNTKQIDSYRIGESTVLYFKDLPLIYEFICELHRIDNIKNEVKRIKTEKTLRKNGTRSGRKSGKKSKSIYDKHKNVILKEYHLGIPLTKISKKIGVGTSQSLGKYIKRITNEGSNEKNNVPASVKAEVKSGKAKIYRSSGISPLKNRKVSPVINLAEVIQKTLSNNKL